MRVSIRRRSMTREILSGQNGVPNDIYPLVFDETVLDELTFAPHPSLSEHAACRSIPAVHIAADLVQTDALESEIQSCLDHFPAVATAPVVRAYYKTERALSVLIFSSLLVRKVE